VSNNKQQLTHIFGNTFEGGQGTQAHHFDDRSRRIEGKIIEDRIIQRVEEDGHVAVRRRNDT
jgi:hypothetical protein